MRIVDQGAGGASAGWGEPITIDFRPAVTAALVDSTTVTIDGYDWDFAGGSSSTLDDTLGYRVVGDGGNETSKLTIALSEIFPAAHASDTYAISEQHLVTKYESGGNPNHKIGIAELANVDRLAIGHNRASVSTQRLYWIQAYYAGSSVVSLYDTSSYPARPFHQTRTGHFAPLRAHATHILVGNDSSYVDLPTAPDEGTYKRSSGVELSAANSKDRGFFRNTSDLPLAPCLEISTFKDEYSAANLDISVRQIRIWRNPGPGGII